MTNQRAKPTLETAPERPKPKAPGRPRSAAARDAVLRAAYDLLVEEETGGFSIEAVATRSGVARTTIYRSWPSKGLLAVDSLLEAFQRELVYSETSDAIADFQTLVDSLVQLLSGKTGRIAALVVAEAQHDMETRRAFLESFSQPLRLRSGSILARGIETGLLRPDLDVPVVLDAVVGGAYMRLLMGQVLDENWSTAVFMVIMQGCLARRNP